MIADSVLTFWLFWTSAGCSGARVPRMCSEGRSWAPRLTWFEKAGLIALGVAQNHPLGVVGLPNGGASGSPGGEVIHGCRLVACVQIEVQAVVGPLRVVHADEEERRRVPVGRPNFDAGRIRVHQVPIERVRPPPRERRRSRGRRAPTWPACPVS